MELSKNEKERVARVASEEGIDGDPVALVRQALAAIVLDKAEDVAYRVAEAAGIEIIGKGIWWKDEAVSAGTGTRGGPEEPMSLGEATRLFEQWRADEYGWLRVRLLHLAYKHGELHGSMVADDEISERNLIGAAINALTNTGLLFNTGEHRRSEAGASHGRKSYVYQLTNRGRAVAQLARPDDWARTSSKKEKGMFVRQAHAIIASAKRNDIYEGPIPEDEEKVIDEAKELVSLAEQAWAQHVRGPKVEEILRIAADHSYGQNGGAEVAQEPPPEVDRDQMVETEQPPPAPAPAPPAPEPVSPDSPGVREPAPAPPASEAAPVLAAEGDDMTKIQPWEGYDDDRDKSIRELMKTIAQDEPLQEAVATLQHVVIYESARRKPRSRILATANELYTQLTGKESDVKEAEPQAARPKAEAPGDVSPQRGAAEGRPEDRPDVADAQAAVEHAPPADAAADASREADSGGTQAPAAAPPRPQAGRADGAAKVRPEADSDLIREVEEELRRERLTIPEPPAEELPSVPWDWTKITDKQLHHLYSAYSAAAYYKSYQLSREERMAWHYRMQADELARELLLAVSKYDEKGKEKKVAVIEAEIESDPNVKMLRRKQRLCDVRATAARQERDQYARLVESLSRIETMRQNEHERAGGLRTSRSR